MSSNDPLEIALRELESLEQLGIAALVAASSPEALETARIEYLGQKQGKLKAAQERLRTLDPAGKRVYGQRFNGVKQSLEAALNAARLRLSPRHGRPRWPRRGVRAASRPPARFAPATAG